MLQCPLPLGALTVLCIDLGTDLLPAVSLAYEEEESRNEAMKRGPRNPRSEGLLDERLAFVSCAQMGLIQAAAGIFTYITIMAENGFWPSKLIGLRTYWDSRAINDLPDSYDQEWTYEDRKRLEYSCHAGFFFSVVAVQWATVLAARTRKLSVFQKGIRNHVLNFAMLFELLVAFALIYLPVINSGLQVYVLYILVPTSTHTALAKVGEPKNTTFVFTDGLAAPHLLVPLHSLCPPGLVLRRDAQSRHQEAPRRVDREGNLLLRYKDLLNYYVLNFISGTVANKRHDERKGRSSSTIKRKTAFVCTFLSRIANVCLPNIR